MVSKAREDLPLPERPVTTTITSRGRETFTSFRLCSRAPRTTIRFSTISNHPFSKVASTKVYGPHSGGQVRNRFLGILPPGARRMGTGERPACGLKAYDLSRREPHFWPFV